MEQKAHTQGKQLISLIFANYRRRTRGNKHWKRGRQESVSENLEEFSRLRRGCTGIKQSWVGETVTVARMASLGVKGGREVSHTVRCISAQDGSVCPHHPSLLCSLLWELPVGRVYCWAPLPSGFWLTLLMVGPGDKQGETGESGWACLVSPVLWSLWVSCIPRQSAHSPGLGD